MWNVGQFALSSPAPWFGRFAVSDEQRNERLAEELKRLQALQSNSTIFDFEPQGDPPSRYVVTFRGQGITRDLGGGDDVEKVDLHRCELRLPYAFPQRPPDIRWLTPVHHPNVSFSGLVKLRDVGLPWEEDLSLDIICERLWDMARLAYYDEERATNYSARNWLAEQDEIRLPIDHRPLRDKEIPFSSNVVKYERRGDVPAGRSKTNLRAKTPVQPAAAKQDDILFIGDESQTTAAPTRGAPPRRGRGGDDDVMYIGYD
jgi:ubiquitin-protein ligase